MGQLSKRYIEVEALRYQYLCDHIEKTESNMKRVLLFSDYRLEKTLGIIKKIENILDKKKYRLSLKLHPMINEKDFTLANKLNIKLEHSLGAALANADIVVGSSYTSSLLDAYCLGWPIITILDGDEVDSSPFKGLDYNFANKINSVNELITKLESLCFIQQKNKIDNFFCLDKELKKWNQLIRDLELG
jgi:surface carbohydrate biosynthesis protein (TIGR04326 family)